MPSRMDKVLGNIAASVAGLDTRAAAAAGNGENRVHLLLVCTAERGLCGPFNSAIVRLARERANCADRRRQRGQVLLRRAQGLRTAAPPLRQPHRRNWSICVRCASSASSMPTRSPQRSLRCSTSRDFDVCTLFFSRFRSVIAQIPTAQQIIPPSFDAKPPDGARRRGLRIRARRGGHPRTSSCRAISRCRSSARSWKTPPRSTARRCRRWTMPPAMPAT